MREKASISDAMAACRLLSGPAVMTIDAEDKQVIREAICEKMCQRFAGIHSASVIEPALNLLKSSAS